DAFTESMAASGDEGQKLVDALGGLKVPLAEAGPLIQGLAEGGSAAVASLADMAMQAGATAEEAQKLAEFVAESDGFIESGNRILDTRSGKYMKLREELIPVAEQLEEVQDQV